MPFHPLGTRLPRPDITKWCSRSSKRRRSFCRICTCPTEPRVDLSRRKVRLRPWCMCHVSSRLLTGVAVALRIFHGERCVCGLGACVAQQTPDGCGRCFELAFGVQAAVKACELWRAMLGSALTFQAPLLPPSRLTTFTLLPLPPLNLSTRMCSRGGCCHRQCVQCVALRGGQPQQQVDDSS